MAERLDADGRSDAVSEPHLEPLSTLYEQAGGQLVEPRDGRRESAAAAVEARTSLQAPLRPGWLAEGLQLHQAAAGDGGGLQEAAGEGGGDPGRSKVAQEALLTSQLELQLLDQLLLSGEERCRETRGPLGSWGARWSWQTVL